MNSVSKLCCVGNITSFTVTSFTETKSSLEFSKYVSFIFKGDNSTSIFGLIFLMKEKNINSKNTHIQSSIKFNFKPSRLSNTRLTPFT